MAGLMALLSLLLFSVTLSDLLFVLFVFPTERYAVSGEVNSHL